MGNVVQNVTSTTADDELQVRNGFDHQRVFDPTACRLLREILVELKNVKSELLSIKEGE